MLAAPAAVAERINDFIDRTRAAAGDPGVAVVVVTRRGIVSCRGFGRDAVSAPVACDTPFAIASLSKSVTAVAVMQLVERRQVVLDAPVTRYLPWFRTASAQSDRITVRDLLNQRSGFDTATGLKFMAVPASAHRSLEDRVRALAGARLAWEPGTHFEYSNANYDVLGAIIEARTGMSYQTYVRERVLAPLGLHGVTFACEAPVHGFVRIFSLPLLAPRFPELCADVPAGGLVMSARQYGRYLAAHLDAGRTWSRTALLPASWTTLHRSPTHSPYAMGWYETLYSSGLREERHNGWAPDFHAFVAFYPALDIGAARLANANEVPDGGRSTPVEIGMERILRGAEPPAVPLIPPDLYLRLGILAALVVVTLRLIRKPRTIRGAALTCAIDAAAIAAILWYVLPQWGYNIRVGFMFSPDLTILIVTLVIEFAVASAAAFLTLVTPRDTSPNRM